MWDSLPLPDLLLVVAYGDVTSRSDRHAYSVLDVREAGGHRLLRLRNPWGHYSWKGAWSDGSVNWTPELRAQLLAGKEGDGGGVFWIGYDDLLK